MNLKMKHINLDTSLVVSKWSMVGTLLLLSYYMVYRLQMINLSWNSKQFKQSACSYLNFSIFIILNTDIILKRIKIKVLKRSESYFPAAELLVSSSSSNMLIQILLKGEEIFFLLVTDLFIHRFGKY